jgi:uncharacterized protein YecT (DUF1311 family)
VLETAWECALTRSFFGLSAACFLLAISVSANGQSDDGAEIQIKHGAAANREYAAVFSRSKTPCSQDYSNAPYLQCMSKELAVIEGHLDAFVEDVRGITGSREELDALNQTDAAWRAYRESACTLPFKRFGSGTVRGPLSVDCRWTLARAYMEQLSDFYILSQFPNRSPSQ